MLGRKERHEPKLFITRSLRQLIPDDHVLVRVDGVLNLSWPEKKSPIIIALMMVGPASIPR